MEERRAVPDISFPPGELIAQYTVLDGEQIAAVLERFGLPAPSLVAPEPRGAVNTGYHVWSGGHRYFLRVNEGKTA